MICPMGVVLFPEIIVATTINSTQQQKGPIERQRQEHFVSLILTQPYFEVKGVTKWKAFFWNRLFWYSVFMCFLHVFSQTITLLECWRERD